MAEHKDSVGERGAALLMRVRVSFPEPGILQFICNNQDEAELIFAAVYEHFSGRPAFNRRPARPRLPSPESS